jgi:hypothetical protein
MRPPDQAETPHSDFLSSSHDTFSLGQGPWMSPSMAAHDNVSTAVKIQHE